MFSSTSILMGVLFGSVGMGYLVYGKKQRRGIPLLSGIGLCVFPYFVTNVFLALMLGIVLMILPFFIRY